MDISAALRFLVPQTALITSQVTWASHGTFFPDSLRFNCLNKRRPHPKWLSEIFPPKIYNWKSFRRARLVPSHMDEQKPKTTSHLPAANFFLLICISRVDGAVVSLQLRHISTLRRVRGKRESFRTTDGAVRSNWVLIGIFCSHSLDKSVWEQKIPNFLLGWAENIKISVSIRLDFQLPRGEQGSRKNAWVHCAWDFFHFSRPGSSEMEKKCPRT